jgi:MFS family permease
VKKKLTLVCTAVFILVLGTGIVAPLLTPYAKTLKATGIEVGLLFSGFYVVRILTGSYIGKLADKKGAKELLRYSLILYPFIGIMYALSSNYSILLIARLLHGLASAMMLPMVMTYIGDITPPGKEAKYMGIYNTVLFLSNSLGPLIGGQLSSKYGYRIAFSSLLFLSLIALGIVCILPFSKSNKNKKEEDNTTEKKIILWNNGRLLSLATINIMDSILSVFILTFYTIFLCQKGINIAFIGLLITVNNAIIGITQIPIAKIVDSFNRELLIIASSIVTIVIIFLMELVTNEFTIVLMFILLGIASAIILSASSALSTILGREKGMGQVMGFLGSATSLGVVIGPLALGVLNDYVNIHATFIFLLISWSIGACTFEIFYRKGNKKSLSEI